MKMDLDNIVIRDFGRKDAKIRYRVGYKSGMFGRIWKATVVFITSFIENRQGVSYCCPSLLTKR